MLRTMIRHRNEAERNTILVPDTRGLIPARREKGQMTMEASTVRAAVLPVNRRILPERTSLAILYGLFTHIREYGFGEMDRKRMRVSERLPVVPVVPTGKTPTDRNTTGHDGDTS